MDGGFFKGTTTEQDSRFSDKQSKLMRQMKFSDILENKIDMSKVDLKIIKPWINKRLTELLGFDDDVVVAYVFNQLETKHPNPKEIQVNLTGFLNAKNSRMFLAELWEILLSASLTDKGVPLNMIEAQLMELKNIEDDEAKIKSQLEDETARYVKMLKSEPVDTKEREPRKRENELVVDSVKNNSKEMTSVTTTITTTTTNNSPQNKDDRYRRRAANDKRNSPQSRHRSTSYTRQKETIKHGEIRNSKERVDRKRSRSRRSNGRKRSGSRRSIERKPVVIRGSPDRGVNRRRENSRDRYQSKKENRSPIKLDDNNRNRRERSEQKKKARVSNEKEMKNILNLDYRENSEEVVVSNQDLTHNEKRKRNRDKSNDSRRDRRRNDKSRRSRSGVVDNKRDGGARTNEHEQRSRRTRRSRSARSKNAVDLNRLSRRENRTSEQARKNRDNSSKDKTAVEKRSHRDDGNKEKKWEPEEIVKEKWDNESESPKAVTPRKEHTERTKRYPSGGESPKGRRTGKEDRRRKRFNSSNSSEEILKKHKIGSMYADRMNEDKNRIKKELVKVKETRTETKSYRRERVNSSEDRLHEVERRKERNERHERIEKSDLKRRDRSNRSRSRSARPDKSVKQRTNDRNLIKKRTVSSSSSSSSSSDSSDSSSSGSSGSSSDSSSSSSSSSDEEKPIKKRHSVEMESTKEKNCEDSFLKEEEIRLRQKALESLLRRK